MTNIVEATIWWLSYQKYRMRFYTVHEVYWVGTTILDECLR